MHRAKHLHLLSLKLKRKKNFFRVLGAISKELNNKNVFSSYLASYGETIVFCSQSSRLRKQNPNGPHKEVKSEPVIKFLSCRRWRSCPCCLISLIATEQRETEWHTCCGLAAKVALKNWPIRYKKEKNVAIALQTCHLQLSVFEE